ncbi:MAG: bacterioferritin [Gammaproteobacteria bacterium]|nr:MAG: bacterioferritin [Gammaproteobacteria bacterium]
MQGDPKVLQLLNICLGNELIAINQYFLHARMFKNWGFSGLDAHEYKKSIVDMKHADKLVERILFLEGLPNLQKLGKLLIGEDVEEIIGCDLSLQTAVVSDIKAAIAHCESAADFVSRDMLGSILESEESQIDWLEAQQGLIRHAGIQNYMQSMMDD